MFVGSLHRLVGCRCVWPLDTPDDELVWAARDLKAYVGATASALQQCLMLSLLDPSQRTG